MISLHEVIIEELGSGATKLKLAQHISQALGGNKRLEFLINKAIETYFEPTKKYIREQFISILKSYKGGTKKFIKDHEFKLGGRIDAMYNICTTKSRGGTTKSSEETTKSREETTKSSEETTKSSEETMKSSGGTKDFDFYGANRKIYKKFLFETKEGVSTSIYIDILKEEV